MVTRRDFLKATGMAGMAAFGSLALAACGESRGAASSISAASANASTNSASAGTSASASAAVSSTAAATADSIVVYFSRADENYGVGYVEQGNTAVLAEMISAKTGSDMFEIKPEAAYPASYQECCDVALEEQHAGARPAYTVDVDLAPYKTVYLGYPIWWGDLPMCVYTFLEAHDWAGKDIHPFCTHEGSGVSGTDSKLVAACAGATVGTPLSMTGTTAQTDRPMAESAVDAWIG